MPASPGDPEEWHTFSWSHEQRPVGSASPSALSTASLSSDSKDGTEDELDSFSLALVMAENRRQHNARQARQRANGGLMYLEWLKRNPALPVRRQHGIMQLVVVRAWAVLVRAKQKFIDIYIGHRTKANASISGHIFSRLRSPSPLPPMISPTGNKDLQEAQDDTKAEVG
ncbi:hypothetical protein E4T43_08674 [Aureobasidium subglaciale]|nr:hypothetical protein E4T43_08674 [Aureobasidium subglaciale]